MNEEQLIQRGDALARQAASDGVLENQLALVLSHLKRHQDLSATHRLLKELKTSAFARRSNQTRGQLTALERHVSQALARTSSWSDAATIVGWAKRLRSFYGRRT